MKMLAVLPLFIVALCVMECFVSAVPIKEPEQYPEHINEPHEDQTLLEVRGKKKKENKNKGVCPEDLTQFGAYCYLVSDKNKTQPEAKKFCSDIKADLVKINSVEENEFVLQLVRQKAPSLKQVWIGLEWIGNAFYWSDLSIPIFTSWAPGEPNSNAGEPCGHMYVGGYPNELPGRASGSWNDIPCEGHPGYPNGIVCKRLP